MRSLSLPVLIFLAAPLRADLSFDIRVTTAANPILGMKSRESIAHVMVKGGSVALREDDMIQVVNGGLNLITLIDLRDQTFATWNLDELRRADDKGFDSITRATHSELIRSGEPSVWKGVAVKRDVLRMVISGGETPGEVIVTSDWVEDVRAFAENPATLEAAEDHRSHELETAIQTLLFEHPERFTDSLKIRKSAAGRNGFQIHSIREMRLAPDAPVRKKLSPQDAERPLVTEETEVLNLSVGEVDARVFIVPAGFQQVEFQNLLAEKFMRRHY